MPVIVYLSPTSPDGDVRNREEFIRGLGETGFVDGHNVNVEYRWANVQYDRLAALAGEFVARKVDRIEAGPLNAALAAKQATSAIPIVFAVAVDPVEFGLVASLSRPGGNLTGVALVLAELMPKRLQLLHETLPMPPQSVCSSIRAMQTERWASATSTARRTHSGLCWRRSQPRANRMSKPRLRRPRSDISGRYLSVTIHSSKDSASD